MDRKFDFTEMDEALSGAGKIQETERMADALEENYKAVRILSERVERLEGRHWHGRAMRFAGRWPTG